MRIKAFISVAFLLLALMAAFLTVPQRHTPSAPSPTMGASLNVPQCASESGQGQALCYWNARTQGNRQGTPLVSGDCAPDYVGSVVASQVCQELYAQPSYVAYVSSQGDTSYEPHGSDLVRECNSIANEMRFENGNENQIVFDDGFSALECFKSHLN